MSIRPAKDCDFDAVTQIYELSKLDELRFEPGEFELLPLAKDDKRLRELLECDIYVYDNVSIMGYGALCGNEIRGLYVHPTAHGQGIGSSLLEHMLNRSSHPATLNIAKSNTPARELYEKYGFKIVKDFEAIYNGMAVTASEMVRVVQRDTD